MNTTEMIHKQLAENPVILYMKGVPTAPECGFSAKTVEILNGTAVPFAYVNVLKSPFIREKLPTISKWPTYPQLFVKGELIGGCDIVEAMSKDGSLLPLLQSVTANATSTTVTHSEVENLIRANYADAKISIEGQGCDLSIQVVSEQFADLSMVKQHQGVMETLREVIASGRLHAVTLKTFTPSQWQSTQSPSAEGLLQIQS